MMLCRFSSRLVAAITWSVVIVVVGAPLAADETSEQQFPRQIQPLIGKYCLRCHNASEMKSGIRVDQLTATPAGRDLFLWSGIQKQIRDGAMPPEDEAQLSDAERTLLLNWITESLNSARRRETQRNGSVRRLTVAQYRNTLRDLLGPLEDLTDVLPPDGISKDGFSNQASSMVLSPLQVEAYFEIADQALSQSLVDVTRKPVIQNFLMELGAGINPAPCPDALVLGANSSLLNNADHRVSELRKDRGFEYTPHAMQTAFEFIEGYAGNDTVRGWRKFNSIYHNVFACLRGTPGYPRGDAFTAIPQGLLVRPAIPSSEIFGQSNTYGPMANFKISLRELPESGNFRITVRAARPRDGLLLSDIPPSAGSTIRVEAAPGLTELDVPEAGIYQVDVACVAEAFEAPFTMTLDGIPLSNRLAGPRPNNREHETVVPFAVVRLPAGKVPFTVQSSRMAALRRLILSRIEPEEPAGKRFLAFEQREPQLGVHLGLRRDCGSTLTRVGAPQSVSHGELHDYVFEGAIRDFPAPEVEKNNVNYLAGIREIGIRSEYTDGRDMPRLLIRSIEFEGPLYDNWPPASHRKIMLDLPQDPARRADSARTILSSFASRAFRRPVTSAELESLVAIWSSSFAVSQDFQRSIQDALVVVLTSPQFLFLIETSQGPEPEDLDPYELASKLSYFLWNTAPDPELLQLARDQRLHAELDSQIDRMIGDPKFRQFLAVYAAEWLSLDKLDAVATDARRYPRLTRDVKVELRQEPVEFLNYLFEQNLPLSNLVQSDFIVANEIVASYYDLGERATSGFRFVPMAHRDPHLGGLLSQAGILAGLSDGRESNPVKRGAWLARKIVAEPPEDPPPNVPQLQEDDGSTLSLRQKLERHRNQPGCAKCHAGIDPWGLPFETFHAGGRPKSPMPAETETAADLPDGKHVANLAELKQYLATDRQDQVAFSVVKHLSCYAAGRSLTYNEIASLRENGVQLRAGQYRARDALRSVIHSDLFLKK